MESHDPTTEPDGLPEHHHDATPIDFTYRVDVRIVLWAIVGLVFLALATWWVLT